MRASTASNKRVRSRKVSSHRSRPSTLAWRSIAIVSCLGALGCQSCMSGEPAREEAPRAPTPPPPEPAPAPAETLEGDEADQEMRREEPAKDERRMGAPSGAAPTTAPRASSGALPERKGEARRRAAEAEAPGAADDALKRRSLSQPEQLMDRLERAVRSDAADCPSAETRKKAVCDLANQICQLVERDPNVASVVQYCADAKERCSQASRRTRERCER